MMDATREQFDTTLCTSSYGSISRSIITDSRPKTLSFATQRSPGSRPHSTAVLYPKISAPHHYLNRPTYLSSSLTDIFGVYPLHCRHITPLTLDDDSKTACCSSTNPRINHRERKKQKVKNIPAENTSRCTSCTRSGYAFLIFCARSSAKLACARA